VKKTLAGMIKKAEDRGACLETIQTLKRQQALLKLLEKYNGPKPSRHQAIAALVLKFGLSGKKLADYTKALSKMDYPTRQGHWSPLTKQININELSWIRTGKLLKVADFLETSEKGLTAKELAKETGIGPSKSSFILTVLEAAKIAKRLPRESRAETVKNGYKWIAFEKRLGKEAKPLLAKERTARLYKENLELASGLAQECWKKHHKLLKGNSISGQKVMETAFTELGLDAKSFRGGAGKSFEDFALERIKQKLDELVAEATSKELQKKRKKKTRRMSEEAERQRLLNEHWKKWLPK
jgi:hypothetical protein